MFEIEKQRRQYNYYQLITKIHQENGGRGIAEGLVGGGIKKFRNQNDIAQGLQK